MITPYLVPTPVLVEIVLRLGGRLELQQGNVVVCTDAEDGALADLDLWCVLDARTDEIKGVLQDRQAIEQLLSEVSTEVRHA